jgi:phosphopantothenoylcysteine decarboxylase/phosphopantothenate--cysteine ligase
MRVLITLGGTKEQIDSVRWIGNESSGRMGYEILKLLIEESFDVIAIVGTNNIEKNEWEIVNSKAKIINVKTTQEMFDSVMQNIEIAQPQIYLSVAAVADYKPEKTFIGKIKKQDTGKKLTINLVQNPDILATVANLKINRPKLVIGFIVEEEKILREQMKQKLRKKNKICILDKKSNFFETALLDKSKIAKIVISSINASITTIPMLY